MRSHSAELAALLNTGNFVRSDAWTITLKGGEVHRWSGSDREFSYLGQSFKLGPLIDRPATSDKMGLDTSTMDLIISGDQSLINFIQDHGWDNANIKLERVYAPDWDSPIVGGVIRFSGRVTTVPSLMGATAKVTVSSWAIILNTLYPANVYQSPCLHVLYDNGCGLNPETFKVSSSVSSASGKSSFTASASLVSGLLDQGRIVFTSGANQGISRSIKSNNGSTIELRGSLPLVPSAGDTFNAYPGCDLTRSTCIYKFNNRARNKSTPFVPLPETAV